MRNIFILYILFFLIINTAFAQDQFYAGLKAGVGFIFHGYDDYGVSFKSPDEKLKYNFNGGAELSIIISKTLSLQSEVIFEDKGYKYRQILNNFLTSENITRGYLQFPELIRYTLFEKNNNAINPFVEAGFYFADHLFTSHVEHNATNTSYPNYDDIYLNKFDWGFTGGQE